MTSCARCPKESTTWSTWGTKASSRGALYGTGNAFAGQRKIRRAAELVAALFPALPGGGLGQGGELPVILELALRAGGAQ